MKAANKIRKAIQENIIKAKNVKRRKKRDLKRVGICVTKHYNHLRKIKDFVFKLKNEFGEKVEIITTGNTESYEKKIKSYALQFDIKYKEFIPSHMQKTLYAVGITSMFGKPYNPKNFFVRDSKMSKYIDYLIVFQSDKDKTERENLIKITQKLQKNVIIIV